MKRPSPFPAAGLIAAASLASGCDLHAQSAAAEGTFERTLQVGRAPEVHITGRSGSIRVTSGPEGTVQVRARIQEELYTMNRDGTGVRQVTHTPDFEEWPDWGTNQGN